jgi:hypothetical protein
VTFKKQAHYFTLIEARVARWFVFKPKMPICEKILGLRLENVDIFYGHLENFTYGN